MARIKAPQIGMFRRAPGLRGILVIQASANGTLYARKWPSKRKRPLPPVQQDQNARFRTAQLLAKRSYPEQVIAAQSFTQKTALMPRDIITKATYGLLITLHQTEGRIYVPMATIQQISAMLDLITNEVGAGLIRGAQIWEGTPPGGMGANWQFPIWDAFVDTLTSGSSYAFKGSKFRAKADMLISGAVGSFTGVEGETYKFVIAEIDGSGVIQAITESDEVVAGDTDRWPRTFAISASLEAGKDYALMMGCTSQGDSYAFPCSYQSTIGWTLPAATHKRAQIAKASPAVGDTVNIADYYAHPIGINVSY